ncbi:SDR family NAD(P)-dependent oxidoreductase [Devosia neptuniae]|uniref:SDR family NAD(P)-dependent oxidoreductase n=1 Tax=Devosia TaxID=46913 RepID=UPI0022AFFE48|nr:SDR family NAD(P)-dependent oxidoreductase [Devosia neptuniae]MCZ4346173.1 SDR family NAD(P)-dependent oxidoreductase [Devosia neptuniae]
MFHQKMALITGAYSAIGREIASQLATKGYDLVLAGRNGDSLAALERELKTRFPERGVSSHVVDLGDHASIGALAAKMRKTGTQLELLIHNAGLALRGLRQSPQGNDLHFEVNAAAPFLLTEGLRDLLRPGSTVVLVGSSAMRMARKLDLEELMHPRRFRTFRPYTLSKLAGAAAMLHLERQLRADNIAVNIVDPGPTKSAMSTSAAIPGWFRLFRPLFKAPASAAQRVVAVATAGSDQSGRYFERGKPMPLFAPLGDKAVQDTVAEGIRQASRVHVPDLHEAD